jgi:hypothetical protein
VLSQYDVQDIASRFQPEIKCLDIYRTLSNTPDALYELCLLAMQSSIQHAKKMLQVLNAMQLLFR